MENIQGMTFEERRAYFLKLIEKEKSKNPLLWEPMSRLLKGEWIHDITKSLNTTVGQINSKNSQIISILRILSQEYIEIHIKKGYLYIYTEEEDRRLKDTSKIVTYYMYRYTIIPNRQLFSFLRGYHKGEDITKAIEELIDIIYYYTFNQRDCDITRFHLLGENNLDISKKVGISSSCVNQVIRKSCIILYNHYKNLEGGLTNEF